MRRVLMAGAGILTLFSLTSSSSAIVSAYSGACGDPMVYQLARETRGPYDIAVGVLPLRPTLGSLRLMVSVCLTGSGQPVKDARVTLMPTSPDGLTGAPIYALNRYGGPEEYDADLSVKEVGQWRYLVEVKGSAGEVTLEVPLEVQPSPSYGAAATTAVFAVTAALLIAGGLYLSAKARR